MDEADQQRPDPVGWESEKETLRIQAAAVAAQQARLFEQEAQLQRREEALRQQEAQIAALLDDKHRRLLEIRDRARHERVALLAERATHEQHASETKCRLAKAEMDVADDLEQIRLERHRLSDLRRRLKQRWHRHWLAEREAMREREEFLVAKARGLESETQRLERERADALALRLRLNTQAVLQSKRAQARRAALRREKLDWEQCRGRQEQELWMRDGILKEAEAKLAIRQHQLEEHACRVHAAAAEAEGLENRIGNLRRTLAEQEQRRAGAVATTDAGTVVQAPAQALPIVMPLPDEYRHRLASLYHLAGDLSDQRTLLRETTMRLLRAHEAWLQIQREAATGLEEAARDLHERECTVHRAEANSRAALARAQQRQDELAKLQRHLEAWQVRLTVRMASWEGERDRRQADLQTREDLVQDHHAALTGLRQRWQERRRRELDWLRAEHDAGERLRRTTAALRDEWLRRHEALGRLQRALAERRLALQQLENERAGVFGNPGVDAARLERSRRTFAALAEQAQEPLLEIRQHLAGEAEALEARFRRWQEFAAVVARQECEQAERLVAWQAERVETDNRTAELRGEARRLGLRAEAAERQLATAQQEVERLAHALIIDDAPLAQQEPVERPDFGQAA